MSAQEEKDSILQLPLPERTVAVALKHIFDQIRAIEQEQAQETRQVHEKFFEQYQKIEQQVRHWIDRQARSLGEEMLHYPPALNT